MSANDNGDMRPIYLDYNATTPMAQEVSFAVSEAWRVFIIGQELLPMSHEPRGPGGHLTWNPSRNLTIKVKS